MKVLFLHGWAAVPGGTKPMYLKNRGLEVLNPALPDEDFEAALCRAQEAFDDGRPDVVVGSSRGGAVAMNIEVGSVPLVLLCPAWTRWGSARTVKPDTQILHSRLDQTVPFEHTLQLVQNSALREECLIVTGSDHSLTDEASLQALHDACVRAGEGRLRSPEGSCRTGS